MLQLLCRHHHARSETKLECRLWSSQLPHLQGGDRDAEPCPGILARPNVGRWECVSAGRSQKKGTSTSIDECQVTGTNFPWETPDKCIYEAEKQMTMWQRAIADARRRKLLQLSSWVYNINLTCDYAAGSEAKISCGCNWFLNYAQGQKEKWQKLKINGGMGTNFN